MLPAWFREPSDIRWFRRRRRTDLFDLFDRISAPLTGVEYTERDRWQDFHRLFLSTPRGKRVLGEIICMADVLSSTVVAGDPYMTHFNEGARDIGLRILEILRRDVPEDYDQPEDEETDG